MGGPCRKANRHTPTTTKTVPVAPNQVTCSPSRITARIVVRRGLVAAMGKARAEPIIFMLLTNRASPSAWPKIPDARMAMRADGDRRKIIAVFSLVRSVQLGCFLASLYKRRTQ